MRDLLSTTLAEGRRRTPLAARAGCEHLCLVLLTVSLVGARTAFAFDRESRPNIVLIMADDLGWSDLGCYGGEIDTPAIDSLARGGLRFSQFYNNAICGPTRASLLTGLYCQQVGHRGDRWNEPKDYRKCVTVAEVLHRAGYYTAMVGKWQGRDSPLDRGFDRFYGPMCQAKISYFHEVQGNPYYLDRRRIKLPGGFYLTDALNDHAVTFLKNGLSSGKPFFLYVAHIAPHWPLHAREAEIAAYRQKYLKLGWDRVRTARLERQRQEGVVSPMCELGPRPPAVYDWERERHRAWQAERMAVYAAQVAAIDRGVKQILAILDEAGAADNTLVLFLSDNGAAPDGGMTPSRSGFGFGPKKRNADWRIDGVPIRPGSGPENLPGSSETFAAYGIAWACASNTPLRGTKLEAYEGGIRTPLIARWPAVIRQHGAITRQPGHVIDFMATFVEMAETEYPSTFQGRKPLPTEGKSLLPVFHGMERRPHEQICWSVPRHDAIRRGRWKAIRTRGRGAWQLYDIEADPTETTDLASDRAEIVKQLADRFAAWRKRVNE